MKTILLFAFWGLNWLSIAAQGQTAGPWRLAERRQRVQSWAADTTTEVQIRRDPVPAAWNVDPATITLLRNCANPLLAPPTRAGIRFTATGATLRLNQTRRQLLLVPAADAVILNAYRGQQRLFAHTFRVGTPPPPTINCYYFDNALATSCKPTRNGHEQLNTLTLKALPNPEFASSLPDDAHYRVAQFRVALLHQGRIIAANTIQGAQVELSSWRNGSQPGDSLRVNILKIERQTFRLAVEPVPMPAPALPSFTVLYQAKGTVAADTTGHH